MAVFSLWGIIMLVVCVIATAIVAFFYWLGKGISPKDEDSPVKQTDNCYLHKKKSAVLLCADCGNSMCEDCKSDIVEVWKTSSQSGNTRTTTTHTRTATVCALCDLAAKEFIKAKAKRAYTISGIILLIGIIVGAALYFAFHPGVGIAVGVFALIAIIIVIKRKNVYKGRVRKGGKDIGVLEEIVSQAKLPEKELEVAKGLQEIGYFMSRFNDFPTGRGIFIFGVIWFVFYLIQGVAPTKCKVDLIPPYYPMVTLQK